MKPLLAFLAATLAGLSSATTAMSRLPRRQFLRSVTASGAGLLLLPTGTLFGRNRPSHKLNVALIGVGGRGRAFYDVLAGENVVALCDVDELRFARTGDRFPQARRYLDWRKCLEQKDVEAVICCTADHHHAPIALWALNRDLHVYMEKPLALSVEEIRRVRERYLKKRDKVATQLGTQRHTLPNYDRIRELVRDGAIGELRGVFAWTNRHDPRPGYLPAAGPPPSTLHWDLWLGPASAHPYNPGYFKAGCLGWNQHWDFGNGQVGDMGSHVMDLVWQAIDATYPETVEAAGDPFNPEVTPAKLIAHFEHPANAWRPALRVSWYQGGEFPTSPRRYLDLNGIGHGVIFKGSQGVLVADFTSRILIPDANADLTGYRVRPKSEEAPARPEVPVEWLQACKGDLRTSCNFDTSGRMCEQMALALVAHRAGRKLRYDGRTGRTDSAAADAFLSRSYRAGWTLDG